MLISGYICTLISFLPHSEMAYHPDLYVKINMVSNQQLVTFLVKSGTVKSRVLTRVYYIFGNQLFAKRSQYTSIENPLPLDSLKRPACASK